jgi:hypothetical protein
MIRAWMAAKQLSHEEMHHHVVIPINFTFEKARIKDQIAS